MEEKALEKEKDKQSKERLAEVSRSAAQRGTARHEAAWYRICMGSAAHELLQAILQSCLVHMLRPRHCRRGTPAAHRPPAVLAEPIRFCCSYVAIDAQVQRELNTDPNFLV